MTPFLLLLVMVVTLTACTSPPTKIEHIDSRIKFATIIPDSVSSAWRDGQHTWFVPKRGATISEVTDGSGKKLPWQIDGPYVKVNSISDSFEVTVNGKPFAVAFE